MGRRLSSSDNVLAFKSAKKLKPVANMNKTSLNVGKKGDQFEYVDKFDPFKDGDISMGSGF